MGVFDGLVGGALGLLGGIGAGKRRRKALKEQEESQMRLNKNAAELNYEYGEKAAQNAHARQLELYQKSYEDQSYKAMRGQMEDAGLSVGLMYGGGGASGGGGGATSGAAQGEAGGAQAGDAGSVIAAQMEQELGLRQLQKQLATLDLDIKLKKKQLEKDNSEIGLNQAKAGAENARALKDITEKEDVEATRELRLKGMYENAHGQFIENTRKIYEDQFENTPHEKQGMTVADEIFGSHTIVGKRLRTEEGRANMLKAIEEAAAASQNAELSKSLKELNDEKKKYIYWEAVCNAIHANAHQIEADARKLATLFETGEMTNWKTWFTTIIEGAKAAGTVIGGIGAGRAIGTVLENVVKPTAPAQRKIGF